MPSGDFVDRVLDIIELLADEPLGLPVSEIARRLDMPKSAAHRLLSSLVNRGFAVQDDPSQRYRLSVKLAAVGFRVLAGAGTSDICQPSLDRLAIRTGELVRLTLVEGDTLFWIAKSQGALSGLRYDPDLGQAVVLHATATGKAWLSTMSDDAAAGLVKKRGYVVPARFGKPVVRDEASLFKELAATRARGYGVAMEEGSTPAVLSGDSHRETVLNQRRIGESLGSTPVDRQLACQHLLAIQHHLRNARMQTEPVRKARDALAEGTQTT